jgi:hypothetical protein
MFGPASSEFIKECMKSEQKCAANVFVYINLSGTY